MAQQVKKPCFELYSENGRWYWRLVAKNGQTLVTSSPYAAKKNAKNAIETTVLTIDEAWGNGIFE